MASSPLHTVLILGRSAGPSSLRRWTISLSHTHTHTHTHTQVRRAHVLRGLEDLKSYRPCKPQLFTQKDYMRVIM